MAIKTRREFLLAGTATGSGLMIAMIPGVAVPAQKHEGDPQKDATKPEEEVSPAEDLMRSTAF